MQWIYVISDTSLPLPATGALARLDELNVRQPIISKRIRELEDELGVFLFDRATSGARLTPTGEEFVVGARRIIEGFQRLSERAKASAAGLGDRNDFTTRRKPLT
ncbi:LysR family transcriptional regulator [Phyllobacterium chamaecytisi]|uniref:LysR family transcriptional regulator n=1 Tax=Phyllobacterium chamaecytisi TaxID=2876082 RepID=UPI001CCF0D3F|nr:LysR family transcriptional regulator [Phyllobacterium sp. KW56]MBZ9605554.1 LysR family transcriptional regulator [Phyllobacterium sp. KW56]